MKITLISSLLFTLSLMPLPVVSDVLLLDAITEAAPNSAEGVPRPSRSMKMSSVEAQFGEPLMRHPTVGEPPITRWDYDGYSVYFEHDLVLTTVVHRK